VAAMPAGSFFGALLATRLADSRLGRRNTVILAGMIWVVGSILQCAAVVRTCLPQRFDACILTFCSIIESWHACGWPCDLWDFRRSL
jgi:MFS family permease